ncbi:rhomboid family intramembrane serine protease [bacterium]|nr:MAG: rhomboid family intramembrane serine protease [bacterium]
MLPYRDNIPSRSDPVVCWMLMLLNVGIFLWMIQLGPRVEGVVYGMGLIPDRLSGAPRPGESLTLITSMFLHASLGHVLGNMLFLYIFGDNVEDRMGHARFLIFYLLCGIGAAALHVYLRPDSTVPTIGASGAISGVLGAYLLLYPGARVSTLVFMYMRVEIPAVLYLLGWYAYQLLAGAAAAGNGDIGGVAWWAHVGGFMVGAALVFLFARRAAAPPPAAAPARARRTLSPFGPDRADDA